MKVLIAIAVCVLSVITNTEAAGRAFPIDSENFVTRLFGLKWDPTNFLVDLSGQYTGCDRIGQIGPFDVDRTTKDGVKIQGIHDYGTSNGNDVRSVNRDIESIVKGWERRYGNVIKNADTFGCSVRPGCDGQASVVCLFNAISGNPPKPTGNPIVNPPGTSTVARAFTPQQYTLTENILGMNWDKSHYLENLAGTATKCAMMGHSKKDIATAEAQAKKKGIIATAQYGMARNMGDTEPAMMDIIKKFTDVDTYGKSMGCALIADCRFGSNNHMYVVVTCLFEQDRMW